MFSPGVTVADDRPSSPISTQVFQILLSLVDDDLHGYAIIQDVAARTEGEVRLTASTLYAAIKRLLETGWIEECRRRPSVDDDARRRYYHLTLQGRQAARAEALRLDRLAAMARAKRLIPASRVARPASS
jgi:DNA-binding PadR family transcriptional regulator